MTKPISESVIVITGASSGMGRATALELANRDATVVVAARRATLLEEVATECQRLGGKGMAVPTDVTSEAAIQNLAQQALSRHSIRCLQSCHRNEIPGVRLWGTCRASTIPVSRLRHPH